MGGEVKSFSWPHFILGEDTGGRKVAGAYFKPLGTGRHKQKGAETPDWKPLLFPAGCSFSGELETFLIHRWLDLSDWSDTKQDCGEQQGCSRLEFDSHLQVWARDQVPAGSKWILANVGAVKRSCPQSEIVFFVTTERTGKGMKRKLDSSVCVLMPVGVTYDPTARHPQGILTFNNVLTWPIE